MKKILCEIAFTADFMATNGEVHAEKIERQTIEIEGDVPAFEEVERQVFMPRYNYDLPQWGCVSRHHDPEQEVVVWVLRDKSYRTYATCLVSYTEAV